jgi:hypothetical protein
MGLWPSSAMVVAPELLERKWHWMGTRSTTTMIAICSPFRRHRKEAHEEKAEDHYHGSQAMYFQTLCKKKDGYLSPPLYTRRKNDAADGVLPIRHGGDGAYAHASLVIRHGGDGARYRDVIRPTLSLNPNPCVSPLSKSGRRTIQICCEKTCTRKKRKLAQDRKHHPDLG